MIIKRCGMLLRTALLPSSVFNRNFGQVGIIMSTPARVKCSWGEKILHIFFMLGVWLTPIAYFHTQLKVWKHEYIE